MTNAPTDLEGVMTPHPNGVALGIILNPREEALLLLKDGGYHWSPWQWGFPGGGIEDGENPEDALLREVGEEFNIRNLEDIRRFGIHGMRDVSTTGKRREVKAYVFSARFNGKISEIRVGEGAGFGFFPRHMIDTLPMVWSDERILKKYYDSLLENQERRY